MALIGWEGTHLIPFWDQIGIDLWLQNLRAEDVLVTGLYFPGTIWIFTLIPEPLIILLDLLHSFWSNEICVAFISLVDVHFLELALRSVASSQIFHLA